MFAHEAVQNGLLAGIPLALAGGLLGYFVVLRGEVFAGDALSHVSFAGAVLASAAALALRAGLFGATAVAALLLALGGHRSRLDDVAIGLALTAILGVGVLALHLLATGALGGQGNAAAVTLFGSLFSLSREDAVIGAAVGGGVLTMVLVVARPLLFASLQGESARARGVPVGLLRVLFLLLLAAWVAAATEALGALLLLGLLAASGGLAQRRLANPYVALALAGLVAGGSLFAGLVLSYLLPPLPASSAVVLLLVFLYLTTVVA